MEKINYVIGDKNIFDLMPTIRAWRPFDERIINFCDKLSKTLIREKNSQRYPDLVTFAFWLRKKNLQRISEQYADIDKNLGKGLTFHIAPSNIPLSFAYSLIMGLLVGNTNIIRLPSRKFEQADIFFDALKEILLESSEIAKRICLIQYPHDKNITDEISAKCHVRIIWGGDNTVNVIRQSPIPPRATEITFANRFSICVINADKYLAEYNPKTTAHNFYIDTYLTDQNACSSPRIIFWVGQKIAEAKKIFWNALQDEIRNYDVAPVTTIDKLVTFCKFAAENECNLTLGTDFKIMRVNVKELSLAILDNIGNSGYFYEYDISDIEEILPICTWQLQTISYIGYNEENLRNFILLNAPNGVDRIVPVGHTMDFGFIWDGHDIVREMTRKISTH